MRMTAASCSSLIVSCAKVQFGHGFCKFSLQLVWYFCQSARIRGCCAAWGGWEVAFGKGRENSQKPFSRIPHHPHTGYFSTQLKAEPKKIYNFAVLQSIY